MFTGMAGVLLLVKFCLASETSTILVSCDVRLHNPYSATILDDTNLQMVKSIVFDIISLTSHTFYRSRMCGLQD